MDGYDALAADDDDAGNPLELRRDPTEGENLIEPANLELFITWQILGGPRNPPTPLELAQWPPAMKIDFEYLTRRMNYIRQKRERRKKRRSQRKR